MSGGKIAKNGKSYRATHAILQPLQ
ncbi:hypothetical protein [Prevotella melaninogenica]